MVNREGLNLMKGSFSYVAVSVVPFPGMSNLAKRQLRSLVLFFCLSFSRKDHFHMWLSPLSRKLNNVLSQAHWASGTIQ
jgi:hypothetical protein